MRQLFPTPIDDVDVLSVYADDVREPHGDRPWLLANMIASLDGATHMDGVSGGLGGPPDRQAFRAIRAVADVILVAAGTARSENYHPITVEPRVTEARSARGQTDRPRLAIMTRHLDLDLDGELFTAPGPPIVFTTEAAPASRVSHAEQRTEVVRFAGNKIDVVDAMTKLGEMGYRVALTEGGPTLIGQLAAADVLDELCLTMSPMVVGGDAARVTDNSTPPIDRRYNLERILEAEAMLLLRYVRTTSDNRGAVDGA